jgi:serine protease Do
MRILIALCLVLITTSCSNKSESERKRDLVKNLSESVVKLEAISGGHGSGFVVIQDLHKYVLTNHHVCIHLEPENVDIKLQDNRVIKGRIIKSNQFSDLCLIESISELPGGVRLAKDVQKFEEILVLGYPHDYPMTPLFGLITSIVDDTLRLGHKIQGITALVHPGHSGSPVVNSQMELVGVAEQSDDHGFSAIIMLSEIKEFLKDTQVPGAHN